MMAALDAVAAPNTSATPRAIVRIIDAFLFLKLTRPAPPIQIIGGRKLASDFAKTMTGCARGHSSS
jgi:hypothetical protein